MRAKDLMDRTINPQLYNKTSKLHLDNEGKIHCSRCAYHRGENKSRTPRRSWKSRTKKRRQHG